MGRGILEFFGEKSRGPPTSWNGFNACLFRNTQTKTSDPPPPPPLPIQDKNNRKRK